MEEQLDNELTQEDIAYLQDKIDFAKDIVELTTKNEAFKRLIKEYTEDYAITQLNNAHSFDNAQAVRFVEKFKARSHFLNFMHEVVEMGRKAHFELNEDGKESDF